MISIDGIQYRNLEEQVLKNKQDIAEFKAVERVLADFGIFIIGNLPTPEDLVGKIGEAYGNAYAIGTAPPYDYYIWTRADPNSGHTSPYWFNIGPLAIEGPRGPVGPKGPNGAEGRRGSITFIYHATQNTPPNRSQYTEVLYGDHAINLNTGEYWEFNGGGTNGWSLIGSLRGPQGPEGPQGPTGETGPIGPQGPTGPRGDPGAFIHIEGILQNVEQLPAPDVLRDLSAAYLIGNAPPYVLWMQIGTSPDDAQWSNLGEINAATFVTVNGVFQNVWSADSKLDKVAESTANGNKIYGTDQYGRTRMFTTASGAVQGSVVVRGGPNGGFNVSTPSIQSPLSVVNKEYVESYVRQQIDDLDPEGEGDVTRQEFNELKESVETLEDERPREIIATFSAPDKSITFDNETSIGRATYIVTPPEELKNMFIDVEYKTASDGVVNRYKRYKITELTKYLDYVDDGRIIGTSYIVPRLSTLYPQTYIIVLTGRGNYADIILDGRLQGPGIYLGRSFKDNAQGTETYFTEVTSVIYTKYLEFLELPEADAKAIIDVNTLPAENINGNAFYRVSKEDAYVLINGLKNQYPISESVTIPITVHPVDTLPEVGELWSTGSGMNVYFLTTEETVYIYTNEDGWETAEEANIPFVLVSSPDEATETNVGYFVYIKAGLFAYNGTEWVEYVTKAQLDEAVANAGGGSGGGKLYEHKIALFATEHVEAGNVDLELNLFGIRYRTTSNQLTVEEAMPAVEMVDEFSAIDAIQIYSGTLNIKNATTQEQVASFVPLQIIGMSVEGVAIVMVAINTENGTEFYQTPRDNMGIIDIVKEV